MVAIIGSIAEMASRFLAALFKMTHYPVLRILDRIDPLAELAAMG
jgi:hypothetical protein